MSRTINHDELLEGLTVPVLLVHGLDDRIVLPSMGEHQARLIPHAKSCWYEQVGHSPFLEVPDRFNADLRAFVASL
jgi:non-heme chloroperoxidase